MASSTLVAEDIFCKHNISRSETSDDAVSYAGFLFSVRSRTQPKLVRESPLNFNSPNILNDPWSREFVDQFPILNFYQTSNFFNF